MSSINQVIKDVFGKVPASFADAIQIALEAISEDSHDMASEDDEFRANIMESFSPVKADKDTVEKVMKK